MAGKELRQHTIPFDELNVFRLTRVEQIPWIDPVSYWTPRSVDIKAIAAIAYAVNDKPKVLDIGCGNAFFSHLLAAEVPVIGIEPDEILLQTTPYTHPDLQLLKGTAAEAVETFGNDSIDVVISSWMPKGVDFSESIYALNPKAIIFIRELMGFTGTRETYTDRENYTKAVSWIGMSTADTAAYFNALCKQLDPHGNTKYYTADQAMRHKNWQEVFTTGLDDHAPFASITNMIDVRLRNDIQVSFPLEVSGLNPYLWEQDLQQITANVAAFEFPSNHKLDPPIRIK